MRIQNEVHRGLCVPLCLFVRLLVQAHALDREAFTFTNYDLDVRIEPEQQRLAVRGKITLRNDSASPQKNLSLQISSSLDWRSIQVEGKPVQFVSQPYTSDIDHTGALSEAMVTLPREVSPKATVELEIGYEGIIPLDATRLTRIGVPGGVARHSDWDQIGKSFTAVRGIGYVAWYPVATEAANLVGREQRVRNGSEMEGEGMKASEMQARATRLARGTPATPAVQWRSRRPAIDRDRRAGAYRSVNECAFPSSWDRRCRCL